MNHVSISQRALLLALLATTGPTARAQHIGVGTNTPSQRLDVVGGNIKISTSGSSLIFPDGSAQTVAATGTTFILNTTTAQTANFNIGGNGYVGGNVGIGTSAPLTRLSISPSAVEPKITLYDGGTTTNHYGFGISGGQLNYHVFSTGDRHVFYAGGKNGDGTELMRIQGNGNVGIGLTPDATLELARGTGGSGTLAIRGTARNSHFNFSTAEDTYIRGGKATSNVYINDNGGNVGIGTTNPIAKLHVNGSVTATDVAGNISYFCPASGLNGNPTTAGNTRQLSAYFEGGQFWVNNCIVAGAMNVSSDRRIKHIVGLSDRAADLALLNKIRVTDYTYIDKLANTDQVVKKVIAQEIQALMPVAVNTSTQAIPNVYEKATRVSFANGRVSVTTAKAHDLPATGGKMRLYTAANVDVNADVTVVDAHTFSFASDQAYDAGLFVYGKFVDDFLSVDYDAIAMLNVSATQELARKVAALEQQNAALQARTAQADADHADLQTMKQQLARLLGEGAQAQKYAPRIAQATKKGG